MKIEIRRAIPSDAAFIVDCNVRLALETERLQLDPARVASGVAVLLKEQARGVYFIAEGDAAPAGQMLVTDEWSDWRNGNFWWVQSVYVAEQFRGRGIFRTLFEHVEALARSHEDVCGLRLYVDSQNSRAQAVYARMGMKKTNYQVFETDFVLNPGA